MRSEIVFKVLFGSEDSIHLLSPLLCAITGKPNPDITLTNPFLLRNYPDEKEGILDVRLTTGDGEQIFIEMQAGWHVALGKRMFFYWARAYGSQPIKGKDYSSLKKTIGICIHNQPVFKEPGAISCLHALEKKTHESICDDFELIFMRVDNSYSKEDISIDKEQWAWTLFLGAETEEEMIMAAEASEAVNNAYNKLKMISQDPEIRACSEARELWILGQAIRESEARKEGREEGLIEGREEGIEIGREEGKVEGREEGLIEGRKEGKVEGREEGIEIGREEAIREMVISMHESGMAMKEIANITRLTNEELVKIING